MTKKRESSDQSGRPSGGVNPADEDLSAFLDGELSPEGEAVLRQRLAGEPALAARLAELAEVTGQVRNVAEATSLSEAEAELEAQRVDRMHAALRVRLSAAEVEEARPGESDRVPSARVITLRPSVNWLQPAPPPVAASQVQYWGAGNFSPESTGATQGPALETPASSELLAESPSREAPAGELEETVAMELALEPAAATEEPGATSLPPKEETAVVDLATVGDEELAIAFDYDVLANMDVIQNLELLEMLDELDGLERI